MEPRFADTDQTGIVIHPFHFLHGDIEREIKYVDSIKIIYKISAFVRASAVDPSQSHSQMFIRLARVLASRDSFLYSVSLPSLFTHFVFSRSCSRLRQGLHYFGCLKANETFLERIDLVQAPWNNQNKGKVIFFFGRTFSGRRKPVSCGSKHREIANASYTCKISLYTINFLKLNQNHLNASRSLINVLYSICFANTNYHPKFCSSILRIYGTTMRC